MEYIVSARKYRPLTFDDVVGQTMLTTTLKNAIRTGKLAHAYLFSGPRGVGKTTCARIFARTINCEHLTADGEACGICENCKASTEQRSLNIFELDAASNNGVDDIRQLTEQIHIPPQIGRYKVFIIDEVHMLSPAAFNAFLKSLEEPPAHIIFILATTEKNKLLPTILSRCQIYDFERITVQDIIDRLRLVAEKEHINVDEDSLAVIAEKADGAMRDALSIFDQVASYCQGNITYAATIEDLNVLDIDTYFRIVDLALSNNATDIMLLLNDIIAHGYDLGNLYQGLARHIRNVMMAREPRTTALLEMSAQHKTRYVEQAKQCSPRFLYAALKILNSCELSYRQSSNKRLLVELTLIEIAQITQEDDDGASARQQPARRLKTIKTDKTVVAQGAKVESPTQQAVSAAAATAEKGAGKTVVAAAATAEKEAGKAVVAQGAKVASPTPQAVSAAAATAEKEAGKTVVAATATAEKGAGKNVVAAAAKGSRPRADIGFTFASAAVATPQTAVAAPQNVPLRPTATPSPAATDMPSEEPFTQEMVSREWLSLCNKMALTADKKGTALRMKNISPQVGAYPAVDVVVENSSLLADLQSLRVQLEEALRRALRNDALSLRLRLAAPSEVKPLLSKAEIVEEIKKSNPAMASLFDGFHLTLS